MLSSKKALQNASKCAAHASLMADLSKASAQAQPTSFHKLLRALLCSGILGRVYTQNIDNLELKAGLTTMGEEPNCVQLHGSVMKVHCTHCSFNEHTCHHFSALSEGRLPTCPRCEAWIKQRKSEGKRVASKSGLLRPAIILYGESHPNADHIAAMQALDICQVDNLLVVGTSLKTFGSVHLIKEISAALRGAEKGRAYYLDLEQPPTSQAGLFDQILQADCQDLAKEMLNQLGTSDQGHSASFFEVGADLADCVEAGRVREDMRPSWDWA